MSDPTAPRRTCLVWDLPTRLFHWLLVLLVAGSWFTAKVVSDVDLWLHRMLGYVLLGLLVFRLLWGFVGGRHSRFVNFVRGPGAVLRYAATLGRRDADGHAGHNPLGALSVLSLLASLLLQVLTGLVNDDEILAAGPLAPLVGAELRDLAGQVHAINFNVLIGLIALHLAAILYYALWRRQNLVRPMITGSAEGLPESEAGTSPPAARALLVLALSVAVVLVVVLGLPEWLPAASGGSGFD
jgi:cytochrome b